MATSWPTIGPRMQPTATPRLFPTASASSTTSQSASPPYKIKPKKDLRRKWEEHWASDQHAQRIRSFDPAPPGNKILKFLRQFPKADCSILVQLRSAHSGLYSYLHRFNAVDSPLCPLCQVPETVNHFLFYCRKYQAERTFLRNSLHPKPFTKTTLLSTKAYGPAILGFVHDTGRFPNYSS